jgi:hypothetical protein
VDPYARLGLERETVTTNVPGLDRIVDRHRKRTQGRDRERRVAEWTWRRSSKR